MSSNHDSRQAMPTHHIDDGSRFQSVGRSHQEAETESLPTRRGNQQRAHSRSHETSNQQPTKGRRTRDVTGQPGAQAQGQAARHKRENTQEAHQPGSPVGENQTQAHTHPSQKGEWKCVTRHASMREQKDAAEEKEEEKEGRNGNVSNTGTHDRTGNKPHTPDEDDAAAAKSGGQEQNQKSPAAHGGQEEQHTNTHRHTRGQVGNRKQPTQSRAEHGRGRKEDMTKTKKPHKAQRTSYQACVGRRTSCCLPHLRALSPVSLCSSPAGLLCRTHTHSPRAS